MSPFALNAAVKGGAIGLALGLAMLTALLFLGASSDLPALIVLLPVATFIIGFLRGYLRHSSESESR